MAEENKGGEGPPVAGAAEEQSPNKKRPVGAVEDQSLKKKPAAEEQLPKKKSVGEKRPAGE